MTVAASSSSESNLSGLGLGGIPSPRKEQAVIEEEEETVGLRSFKEELAIDKAVERGFRANEPRSRSNENSSEGRNSQGGRRNGIP